MDVTNDERADFDSSNYSSGLLQQNETSIIDLRSNFTDSVMDRLSTSRDTSVSLIFDELKNLSTSILSAKRENVVASNCGSDIRKLTRPVRLP